MLLGPLTGMLSPQGFLNTLLLLQIPMLAAMPFLTARIARPKAIRLPIWVAIGLALISLLMPGISALYFNQPTITATFLVLLAAERMGSGRPAAAGTALALAAALKLSPALFALVFVFDRQWRALAVFALAGAALAALSVALAGPALHHDFLEALRHATAHVVLGQSNSSLRALILIAAAALSGETGVALAAKPLIVTPWLPEIGLLPSLAFALALAALMPLARIGDATMRRTVSLLALGIMVPLFGPIGWTHYYLLPMLLAPALPALLPGRATVAPLAALVLMLPYPLFLLSKTFVPGQTLYVGLTTLAWLWLLVAVITGLRATAAIREPTAQTRLTPRGSRPAALLHKPHIPAQSAPVFLRFCTEIHSMLAEWAFGAFHTATAADRPEILPATGSQ